ncbi:MAG: orotate phosphoribosyltransferase [uncultured bacterium]|uniref:Orotate phosphoribosyltransferase n=1 Tax=Candidatus Curtissbacteria bacterium RIFOXYA1_FULL_41_14 TaxID=1797737 RepID=A0A1F5HAB9_9BACT|nr:MAG: orotate phosphoribosyltransferase [uncultured bacterium]KKR60757.1 MAG: Orotate phosphoribosyltransferase [Candidatus Curtissbacteria bacterium GW2011_GWA2_40_31]KKR77836.1 MAG: Orotate phosphoribosyltransferase [Candidatus Curtissbacteria bacterium GW2011_GWD1_40_8]OGD96102.1 MAG: orotate phosphoribosyltransferase [Candidatus Curtissbacteria bacterium RIFCSPLOWO2_01_FULL_41_28]OGE01107.1 MAG: orotate phosphoribosyltransferase [Candidatus Curtissbacteria bacterium RIFOXYA1_FULL_41_14]O
MKSTNTDNISKKVAKILIDVGCVIFRPRQPFKFDSGILSPVYVDNRLLISRPKERKIIIKYLVDQVRKIGIPDVVAGVATAGITHAAWIAQKLDIPMVYVRAEPKSHGRKNQVEGNIKRGQKVIIVEDMISTAGSSIRVLEVLKKLGAQVTDEVAIYTHNMKAADRNFQKSKIKFHALTNLDEVIKVAVSKGFLKSDQVQIIKGWTEDPQNWGKKMGFE